MIDTGGTIMRCVDELKKFGANRIFVFVTHGLFNGDFYENLAKVKNLDKLYVTDSLPVKDETKESNLPIKRLSLRDIIMDKIKTHWSKEVN